MKLGLKGTDIGGALGGSKMTLDDSPLAGLAPKSDNKRIDTIDGTVTDIKNQLETMGLGNKALKGDVDKIRSEIDGINDSIKNLLCVYEAVSREYNPFVDSEMPSPRKAENVTEKAKVSEPVSKDIAEELNLDDLDLDLDLDQGKTPVLGKSAKIPDYIEAEPMDKILKPENDEDDVAQLVEKVKITKVTKPTKPQVFDKPAPIEKAPDPIPEPSLNVVVDFYSINQVHKLVEHQLEQIYAMKLKGQMVPEEEYASLERWMAEYKRMGVK
ncbi:MAG TPA: flagella accessory protein C [Methanomassiliicoccales archaeon]|jgi:archaellum component FlaC